MKREDIDTMTRAARPIPAMASRADILNSVASVIQTIHRSNFKSLRDVENASLATLRATPIAGTVFEPIATALGACGVDAGTTVGGSMDVLGLTQDEVNSLACYCENGDEITAERTASNLRGLAAS